MPFAAAVSTLPETALALDAVCSITQVRLGGPPDLALVFYSHHHLGAAEFLAASIQEQLAPRQILGCVGEAIIAGDQEIDTEPALTLWTARWNTPIAFDPFHLVVEETSEGYSLLGWPDAFAHADPNRSAILLVGDPFTFPADLFLNEMNETYPGLRVVGGMASGIGAPGACRLFQGTRVVNQGAVGLLMTGDLKMRCVVSQGCRPLGRPMVITRGHDNVIQELAGKPPLLHLKDIWQGLSPHDQDLFRRGLHVGRVINEYREGFGRGDFLIRNVIQMDQQSGALAISDRIRVGQTVQFHLRDAATADEDLRALLRADRAAETSPPAAALLFSCNGRGTRMFQQPHHDARAVRESLGNVPLTGFFAQGELGPIGGQNFIHGYTASITLFEE